MFHVKRRLRRHRRWAVVLLIPAEPGWPGGEVLSPLRRTWTFPGAIQERATMVAEESRWAHQHPDLLVARLDRHGFVVASWAVDARGRLSRREVPVG